jgi:putative SOS response-associated peptidase YedK
MANLRIGEAYRKRRSTLPVNGFFEWKAMKAKSVPCEICGHRSNREAANSNKKENQRHEQGEA